MGYSGYNSVLFINLTTPMATTPDTTDPLHGLETVSSPHLIAPLHPCSRDVRPSLDIIQWIRPEIRAISAYHVADPGQMVKLDAMENPYRWPHSMPAELMAQWVELVQNAPLNRYPDPSGRGVTDLLRTTMQVPEGMGILLGNGSDELIQTLALAVAQPGRSLMAPTPSFVMYQMIATFAGMAFVGVPLAEGFALDLEAMVQQIRQQQPALIFIAYPNNPTGNLFDDSAIEAILRAADGVVVVDEAYHAFAQQSWMGRLGEYDNLLVMRTLSKLGLAGLRLGMVAGPAALLEEFNKVRLPYNINTLTQLSAQFALQHQSLFDDQTATIRQQRSWVMTQLEALDGVTPFPSAANFILFRVADGQATTVFEGLKQHGILIKNMGATAGPLAHTLRTTIGLAEENQLFIRALTKVLATL